jgi:hypothetical protein
VTLRDRVQVVPGVPGHLHLTIPMSMGMLLLTDIGAYADGQSVGVSAYVFAAAVWFAFVVWHVWERARLLRSFWATLDGMDWEQVVREHGWAPEQMLRTHVACFNRVWGREILRLDPNHDE